MDAQRIISENVDTVKRPHALHMGMLPKEAKLIDNPVNNMPAFQLEDRYFFMPGFPEMSHPMVEDILSTYFKENSARHRYTLTALCREGDLIPVMEQMPDNVEFSSLPKLMSDGWQTTISVASQKEQAAKDAFGLFLAALEKKNIPYSLNDNA